jgi:ferric-dicitrate binding protein FerR (iron transport regulator)
MKGLLKAGFILLTAITSSVQGAAAQGANADCSSESSQGDTQKLRCGSGVTIIAEKGARFALQRDRAGRIEAVELNGKALLIEVPAQSGGAKFQVTTPQAIAAVRGTKWAVDASGDRTSVFVVNGQVRVGRLTGSHRVTLGPGEGVDVEPGSPLTVKRWAPARVSALLARLGGQAQ